MATTLNLLDYNNALYRKNNNGRIVSLGNYSTEWTISPTTNIAFDVVSDVYSVNTRYSLRITPLTAAPFTVSLTAKNLKLLDNNRVLSFNCKLKSTKSCDASTRLSIVGESLPDAYAQSFNSGEFNAVESNRIIVPDDDSIHQYTIDITISNHDNGIIYLTNFNLIHDLAFYENPFVPQIRKYIPDFYWEYDSDEEYPTYPFFKLIDILSSAAGDTRRLYNSLFPYEIPEFEIQDDQVEYWAKSSLTTPALVKDEYIPWVSQFNGVKIQRNSKLPDGSLYFNNPGLQRDYVEWQIRTGYYGTAAGTRAALIAAARQFLVRTKNGQASTFSVAIQTEYLGDPFSILVQTLTNETLDAPTGESSQLVLNSLNLARPLGYKILHTTVDEFDFTFDSLSLGRFDEFTWG